MGQCCCACCPGGVRQALVDWRWYSPVASVASTSSTAAAVASVNATGQGTAAEDAARGYGLDSDFFELRNYELQSLIGMGATSKVYRVVQRVGGESRAFALKLIDKTKVGMMLENEDQVLAQLRREIDILRRMNHPNIIRFHEVIETSKCIYMVMALCRGGDLSDFLRRHEACDELTTKAIMRGVLSGAEYMHHLGVLHRDIKLENLLVERFSPPSPRAQRKRARNGQPPLEPDIVVKFIDFGFSTKLARGIMAGSVLGTSGYMAPEMRNQVAYTESVDIWACGVVMYVLIAGSFPFPARYDPVSYAETEASTPTTDEDADMGERVSIASSDVASVCSLDSDADPACNWEHAREDEGVRRSGLQRQKHLHKRQQGVLHELRFEPRKRWNHISDDAQDLLRNMLQATPQKRFLSRQALAHRWFRSGSVPAASASAADSTAMRTSAPASQAAECAAILPAHPLTLAGAQSTASSHSTHASQRPLLRGGLPGSAGATQEHTALPVSSSPLVIAVETAAVSHARNNNDRTGYGSIGVHDADGRRANSTSSHRILSSHSSHDEAQSGGHVSGDLQNPCQSDRTSGRSAERPPGDLETLRLVRHAVPSPMSAAAQDAETTAFAAVMRKAESFGELERRGTQHQSRAQQMDAQHSFGPFQHSVVARNHDSKRRGRRRHKPRKHQHQQHDLQEQQQAQQAQKSGPTVATEPRPRRARGRQLRRTVTESDAHGEALPGPLFPSQLPPPPLSRRLGRNISTETRQVPGGAEADHGTGQPTAVTGPTAAAAFAEMDPPTTAYDSVIMFRGPGALARFPRMPPKVAADSMPSKSRSRSTKASQTLSTASITVDSAHSTRGGASTARRTLLSDVTQDLEEEQGTEWGESGTRSATRARGVDSDTMSRVSSVPSSVLDPLPHIPVWFRARNLALALRKGLPLCRTVSLDACAGRAVDPRSLPVGEDGAVLAHVGDDDDDDDDDDADGIDAGEPGAFGRRRRMLQSLTRAERDQLVAELGPYTLRHFCPSTFYSDTAGDLASTSVVSHQRLHGAEEGDPPPVVLPQRLWHAIDSFG